MYNPYPQNYQQPMQIQDGGFVSVRNEMEARSYPVRYGNSVTFKDETAPYIYVKTMGFSQLDTPIFDKYRLVKEEPTTPNKAPEAEGTYKLAFDELKGEIDALKADMKALREELGDE
jgi:hypothetical protein